MNTVNPNPPAPASNICGCQTAPTTADAACCDTAACCDPADKAGCCGGDPKAATCGCK